MELTKSTEILHLNWPYVQGGPVLVICLRLGQDNLLKLYLITLRLYCFRSELKTMEADQPVRGQTICNNCQKFYNNRAKPEFCECGHHLGKSNFFYILVTEIVSPSSFDKYAMTPDLAMRNRRRLQFWG